MKVFSNKTWGNTFKLNMDRFRLGIMKNIFIHGAW